MLRQRRHGPGQPCGVVTVVLDLTNAQASVVACKHVPADVVGQALADLAAKVNAERLAAEAGEQR